VQLGHHHLDAREPGTWLHIDGDAAAVVMHLDRAVGAQDHRDLGAPPAEGLVDRVVQDLPQAVHEAA